MKNNHSSQSQNLYKQQNAPKVNVLIASHNYGEYIQRAVMSAVNSDYRNIMITIVDCGSTDDSVEKISKMINSDVKYHNWNGLIVTEGLCNGVPTILIEYPEKKNPAFTRNLGISYTIDKTDVYAILDADDYMEEYKISRMLGTMFHVPNIVGVVYADYITVCSETLTRHYEFKETFSRERLMQDCIVHSGALITAKALKDVRDDNGFYDENLDVAEDWDLWLRISSKYMILHHPEFLTCVTVSRKNTTNTVSSEIWKKCWEYIDKKHRRRG